MDIRTRIYKEKINFSAKQGNITGKYFLKWQRKLQKYKDIHKGKTAFLIGNGPSVRTEDLETLKHHITFCCNKFYMSYNKHSFRPTYTVSADDEMIKDFGDDIVKNSKGDVWFCSAFPPDIAENNYHWLYMQSERLDFSDNAIQKGVYHTGATLLAALQIGYYMGIRKFVLYGVDHNIKYLPEEDQRVSKTEGNHFIQNYREGKSWFVPDTQLIEESFKKIAELLEIQGGYLLNASRETHLPYVERILFEESIVL